ncbi:hypothetical protein TWF694_001100 [Orbilia ellipsospora]|uniref:Uncharacterized protein n=1 Tax=Orbilia ellipsospora TaxID=2528407 RepID=A0AAV9XQL4_9PEZI
MPVSMPQFRFPFSRKAQPTAPPAATAPVEDPAPIAEAPVVEDSTTRSHKREKSSGSISIITRRSREEDNNVYKLSTVNDSGVYLPPSPVEKKGYWGRRESTNGSPIEVPNSEDIGFAISRESFDSYRRSFDISARTQVSDSQRASMQSSRSSLEALGWGMSSLDAKPNRMPSIDVSETVSDDEDGEFRDIDLNDNSQAQKKRHFLGRFSAGSTIDDEPQGRARSSTATWRREHNRDAEELGAMIKGSNLLISA